MEKSFYEEKQLQFPGDIKLTLKKIKSRNKKFENQILKRSLPLYTKPNKSVLKQLQFGVILIHNLVC